MAKNINVLSFSFGGFSQATNDQLAHFERGGLFLFPGFCPNREPGAAMLKAGNHDRPHMRRLKSVYTYNIRGKSSKKSLALSAPMTTRPYLLSQEDAQSIAVINSTTRQDKSGAQNKEPLNNVFCRSIRSGFVKSYLGKDDPYTQMLSAAIHNECLNQLSDSYDELSSHENSLNHKGLLNYPKIGRANPIIVF